MLISMLCVTIVVIFVVFFLFKQKTAYEILRSDWSSDVCSSDLWLREGLTARRRRNQGRVRALQQMRAERGERQGRQGTAKLDPAEAAAGGKLVIEAEDVAKRFPAADGAGETVIVRGFSTRIQRRRRRR